MISTKCKFLSDYHEDKKHYKTNHYKHGTIHYDHAFLSAICRVRIDLDLINTVHSELKFRNVYGRRLYLCGTHKQTKRCLG